LWLWRRLRRLGLVPVHGLLWRLDLTLSLKQHVSVQVLRQQFAEAPLTVLESANSRFGSGSFATMRGSRFRPISWSIRLSQFPVPSRIFYSLLPAPARRSPARLNLQSARSDCASPCRKSDP
jgi:hypothetical protein